MRRSSPWQTVILLGVFAWLVWLYFRQGTRAAAAAVTDEAAQKNEDRRVLSLRRQLADAEVAETKAKASASTMGAGAQPMFHMDDLIREHPELAAIHERERRRAVMRQYGPVLAGLALPPDTLARVKDLLLERLEAKAAAGRAALAAGFTMLSPEWKAAEAQAGQEAEVQVTAALRAAGSVSFEQLDAQVGYYDLVQRTYGTDLADAGAAATPAQAQALVQALTKAAADPAAAPPSDDQPDPSTGLSPHDNRFLTLAGQILTNAQIAVIRDDRLQANEKRAIEKSYAPNGQSAYIAP